MDETTGANSAPVPPVPPVSPSPPRSSRKRTVIVAVVGLVAIIGATAAVTAALVSGPDQPATEAKSQPTVSTSPVTEEATEETPEEIYNETPDPDDFSLDLKTTHNQCFGSAGCNITVEPDLSYLGLLSLDPEKTISITYEIHGDESGPVIETMELTSSTELSYRPSNLSTVSSTTKISAKVTDVEVSY